MAPTASGRATVNPVRPVPRAAVASPGHVRDLSRPHRHARRAAARVGALAGADRHVRRRGRAVRVRAGARPDVRGPRRVPAGRRGHRRRPQGDVRLPRQGRPPPRPAARGHGLGGPGVRAAPAAHAVEGLVRRPGFRYERPQAGRYRQHHQVGVEVLGAADPDVDVEVIALGADVPRRRSGCGGSTLRGQLDGRRPTTAPATPTRSRPGCAERGRRPGRRTTGRRSRRTRCGCSTASAPRPRPWSADAPRIADHLVRRVAGPTSSGSRRASTRSASRSTIEPRPGPGPRLLHAHHVRVPEPRRSTPPRPRSAAAAATTAWSSSSAGRRRPASASARASSGSCSPATPRACSPRPAPTLDVFVVDVTGGDGGPRPHRRAAPRRAARRPGLRRPVDEGADEGGRPLGRPAAP